MEIFKAHSYLTHPAKAVHPKPKIRGADVPSGTKLYEMLADVLEKSATECDIEISFDPANGEQQNQCRDLITAYVDSPTLPRGRKIAESLQSVTTNRSGMGLLFLVVAKKENQSKLLVSRFPADVGVLAEEAGEELNVEFVEKVFMKNANTYKSVVYTGDSTVSGFWDGKATDKQISNSDMSISDYWIKEFLQSDFKTTPAAGTRRLAVAMRNAIQESSDVEVKSEIAAAAQLVETLPKQRTSIFSICSRFNFSDKTRDAVLNELPNSKSASEKFVFSSEEFARHIQYRSMELDNGGRIVADAARFNAIFEVTRTDADGNVAISTQGKIIDERLRKSK